MNVLDRLIYISPDECSVCFHIGFADTTRERLALEHSGECEREGKHLHCRKRDLSSDRISLLSRLTKDGSSTSDVKLTQIHVSLSGQLITAILRLILDEIVRSASWPHIIKCLTITAFSFWAMDQSNILRRTVKSSTFVFQELDVFVFCKMKNNQLLTKVIESSFQLSYILCIVITVKLDQVNCENI